jgi:membrane protease YdiL (CAAX protease family)
LIVAVLASSFLVNFVYVLCISALGWKSLLPSPLPEVFKSQGVMMLLMVLLAIGLAPLAEEVFFRGFFFGGLQARWGFARAAGVSALVFSLGHLQLGVIVPIFILGIFLAWLYARTGSVWPCIITHMAYNGLGVLAFNMT